MQFGSPVSGGLVHVCYDVITVHPRAVLDTCFIYSIRTYVRFRYSDITDVRKSGCHEEESENKASITDFPKMSHIKNV
jgi:hypothetical protein